MCGFEDTMVLLTFKLPLMLLVWTATVSISTFMITRSISIWRNRHFK